MTPVTTETAQSALTGVVAAPGSQNKRLSLKQRLANRLNAQRSTGPRSPEGKRKSALNATRHGLTSQVTMMTDEDREAYLTFIKPYIADLKPEGAVEQDLAVNAAECAWRLRRIQAIESNILAMAHPDFWFDEDRAPLPNHPQIEGAIAHAQAFAKDPHQFQLLSVYEQRTQRAMHKSLTELKKLQAERKAAREQALAEASLLAELAESEGKTYDPAADFPANGFVFSNAEIAAAIDRDRRLKLARQRSKPSTPARLIPTDKATGAPNAA